MRYHKYLTSIIYRNALLWLSLGLLTISAACKKLPVYESKQFSKAEYCNEFFNYYDAEYKIRYEFYNDEEYFYLKMDTHDKLSKMKILNGGLKIVIDTLAKTNIEQFVQYPLSDEMISDGYEKENALKSFSSERSLQDRISLMPKQAIVQSFRGKETIDIIQDTTDFRVRIYEDSIQNLVYELRFPLNYFSRNESLRSDFISIGIVSGELDIPENKNEMVNNVSPINNGRYNGRTAYRAQSNMQSNMRMMRNEITKAISIWFKLKFI